jgi:hypothetical protein
MRITESDIMERIVIALDEEMTARHIPAPAFEIKPVISTIGNFPTYGIHVIVNDPQYDARVRDAFALIPPVNGGRLQTLTFENTRSAIASGFDRNAKGFGYGASSPQQLAASMNEWVLSDACQIPERATGRNGR